jgi:23S rRNA (uracil1939-C5)-methyltransferase
MINAKIEKLVFGGQGLGRVDNKVVMAFNALPGEEVEIEVIREKKNFIEGIASNIIVPSPDRIEPEEDHFLSCSPWQILSWEAENRWKKEICRDVFRRIGGFDVDDDIELVTGSDQYHYRNKIEYNFISDENGLLALAMFNRGTHVKSAVGLCKLAQPSINKAVDKVFQWLLAEGAHINYLRNIIAACDDSGRAIVTLYLTRKFAFTEYPEVDDCLGGLRTVLLDDRPQTKSSKKLLHQYGQQVLSGKINDTIINYSPAGFFQVNPPVFEKAVDAISGFLDEKMPLLDFYSGAGAISLPLASKFSRCTLVDIDSSSINWAKRNIKNLDINNCEAVTAPSESMLDKIESGVIALFNPPRAGLPRKIVDKLLAEKPVRIIYLSCNPSTQARDLKLLSDSYKISFQKLYNFYPRTPHVESLAVMDRING